MAMNSSYTTPWDTIEKADKASDFADLFNRSY